MLLKVGNAVSKRDGTPADSLDDCGLRFLLAMKHYGYLLRCLPLAARAALQRAGVGTCNLVWAFHSETHAQLLALVPGYTKGQPKWATMRELGNSYLTSFICSLTRVLWFYRAITVDIS